MSNKLETYTTFITGATGFIAFELIKNILENESSGDLYLLIRANKRYSAAYRFKEVLKELVGKNGVPQLKDLTNRIHLVEGDITQERFGMNISDYEFLSQKINRIYHVAASVHLTGDLDKMLKTNVDGTKKVLDFALNALNVQNDGEFDLFNYVSTAYIAGKRKGVIYENELNKNQEFNNNYEKAKYEAEVMIKNYIDQLPIAVYRPSIVMGHSETGWTKTFNVLYEPMKMVYFGSLRYGPVDKNSIVDIVPVDYVAKGVYYISRQKQKAVSNIFHLSCGRGKSINFKAVVEQITDSLFYWADHYKVENPKKIPILIKPTFFKILARLIYLFSNPRQKRKIKKMLTYTDYVAVTKDFDTTGADEILRPLGVICPTADQYLDTLCRYAVENHFGKSNKPENVYSKGRKHKLISGSNNVVSTS